MASMDTTDGPSGRRGGYRGGGYRGGNRGGGGYYEEGRRDYRNDNRYDDRDEYYDERRAGRGGKGGRYNQQWGYDNNRGGRYNDGYDSRGRDGYEGGQGQRGGRGGYDGQGRGGYDGQSRGGYRGRGRGRQNWGGGRPSNRPSTPEELPDDLALVTELPAHANARVTAIVFDEQSQQLYTGGQDRNVKIWSCATGQCTHTVDVGGEVDSMMIEGGFLIVGLHDGQEGLIKIWNMSTSQSHMLSGHQGQVLCLASGNNALISGGQDRSIRIWSFNPQAMIFSLSAIWSKSQQGHDAPVQSLVVQGKLMFSADFQGHIKVWDLEAGRNLQTIEGHKAAITKLLVWQTYLLSGSLDGSVKVWAPIAEGGMGMGAVLQVDPAHVFQDQEDSKRRQGSRGVILMHGTLDKAGNELLMVGYTGLGGVKLYELPSLTSRGILYSGGDPRSVTSVPKLLLITGSVSGKVKVFQWK